MGENFLRTIRILLTAVIILLAIPIFLESIYTRVIATCMLACIGAFQIFNGMHFYKHGKKTSGILFFLTSVIILGFVARSVLL